MNLNISAQMLNNCLGNNVTESNVTSKTDFVNLFEGLSKNSEDLDLKSNLDNLDEEKATDIDYSVLVNLLNNIQNIDDLQSKNQVGNTNNPSELLNVNLLKNDEDILGKINKEDALLLNLIKDNLDKKIDDTQINDGGAVDEVGNKIENKTFIEQIIEGIDLEDENQKNKLKTVLNEHKDYEQLEANSILNKNKIVQENNIGVKDKDLDTLEKILNNKNTSDNENISINKENNSFIYSNNTNNNVLTNITQKESVQTINTTVNREFITEDIVKNINYLKSNGLEEIKIKITPKELGDMTIQLVKNLEETKVHIIVSKEDVFDLVNKNIGDISKHLKDLNINVKEVSVDVRSNNEKFFSDNLNQEFNRKNQQNKKQRNRFSNSEIESVEETKESKSIENNLNILI